MPTPKTIRLYTLLAISFALPFSFNACGEFLPRNLELSSMGSVTLAKGDSLYATQCASCHDAIDSSTKLNRTSEQISNAIVNVEQMKFLASMSPEDLDMIAASLGARTSGRKYICTDTNKRGFSENGMRRLSFGELTTTLGDLFGSDVIGGLTSLAALPQDRINSAINDFNPDASRTLVNAYIELSLEVGSTVGSNAALLQRIAPACVHQNLTGVISDTCLISFIDSFGPRVHRRPLEASQRQMYLDFYKAPELAGFSTSEKIQSLISRMIEAPEMQFLYLVASSPVATGGRARLDAFSVANRLSYSLTAGPPDAQLVATAASGDLLKSAVVQQQAKRLFETERGRAKSVQFAMMWLNISNSHVMSELAASLAGLQSQYYWRQVTRDYAVLEFVDYVSYVIQNDGTFYDLMTKNYAFPKHPRLAEVMGTGVYNSGTPLTTTDGRIGLFARPAFLTSIGDRESPIQRGARLRTRFLCDPVSSPPADLDGAIADAGSSFDQADFSIRDVTDKVTASGTCMTCHSQLNALGYALGNFGPTGKFQASEKTYRWTLYNDAEHQPWEGYWKVAGNFPVNTSVKNLNIVSANDSSGTLGDFAELMGRSAKGRSCMAVNMFRESRMRMEKPSDACALAELESMLISGMTIKEAILKLASSEDILWRGF